MLENLKAEVYTANRLLAKSNPFLFPWCNVTGFDRERGLIVAKPSHLGQDRLAPEDLVVVDLNGNLVEGSFGVPSDIATHIELYNAFPKIQGIVHSYFRFATIFAQMGMGVPALGTIHADYFHGEIPCTRKLRAYEIRGNYEKATGSVIVERFKVSKLSPEEIPGVLVCNHGPFTWGARPADALSNAFVLEEVAFMAWHCLSLPDTYLVPMQKDLLERHFERKHGGELKSLPADNDTQI